MEMFGNHWKIIQNCSKCFWRWFKMMVRRYKNKIQFKLMLVARLYTLHTLGISGINGVNRIVVQCIGLSLIFLFCSISTLKNVSHVCSRLTKNEIWIWIWICWLELLSAQLDTFAIFYLKLELELEFTFSMLCILMANFTCFVMFQSMRVYWLPPYLSTL